MNNMEIDGFAEAQALLAAHDAGELYPYVGKRVARDMADFWLENRFPHGWADDDSEEESAYYAVLSALEALLEEEE
jgi:hypothetical protein